MVKNNVYLQKQMIITMRKEELKDKNPWNRVVENFHANETDCLLLVEDKGQYVCMKDKKAIQEYNTKCAKAKKEDNQIITNTPPEPWRGNPLEANLVILSLNPGYSHVINETLAKLIQSNDIVRTQLANFRKRTLSLDAESFLPEDEKKGVISCEEAEDMLSGWYWSKRFYALQKELEMSANLTKKEFYRKVAVIEYHGYSSKLATTGLPLLPSQEFVRNLVKYISSKESTVFLIMRAMDKWEPLLNRENDMIWDTLVEKKKLIYKTKPGRCQYITKDNLKECNNKNGYEIIKDVLLT